jgi:hypothetical protein
MAGPPAKPALRAGAATSNITPFLGANIVGGFIHFPSTSVHDELHARCLVLDDGEIKLALVVCDLLSMSYSVCAEARKLIQKEMGIPAENVLICAVHTHSGCAVSDKATDDYHRLVVRRIADGVKIALGALRPAQMAFVTAQVPEHVFNRRWLMKPGTAPPNPFGGVDQVKMNPTPGSPNLVEPAGPTDPAVSVLALREPRTGSVQGKPIAVFSSYSLHYVGNVNKGDISADYYGMYCRELKRLLGAQDQDPPFVAMMANGTSGDVASTDRREPEPKQEPYVKMRGVAEDVARKVHAALAKAEYRGDVTLAARFRELTIAARRPTPEQMAWAEETLAHAAAPVPDKADMPVIYARRTIAQSKAPETVPAPLQVFRIGPVCIATMPCEVFCEIGLAFKKKSAVQPAFLVSLTNGALGYVPTPRHFALGGYETWLGTNRLEPQAGEKMLSALLEMSAEVKP